MDFDTENSLAIAAIQVEGAGGGRGGGKGGGASSRTPTEDPTSLRSRSTVSIVYLLSEGEIQGTINGNLLRDIYLDETPIQNADGSFNFANVQTTLHTGTQSQSYIPGYSEIENEVSVGVIVKKSTGAIVRTVSDPNVDAIKVRISLQGLQEIDSKSGDVRGRRVDFAIDIATNGGAYVRYVNGAIAGKTSGAYERQYRIQLPKPGTSWQIRVTRITDDSTSTKVQDEITWASYTQLIDAKLRYPNSAILALRISAEQFNSVPSVAMGLLGVKFKIPSNYNPFTRTYSGFWNGTFAYGWTNNPAWIFYGILTNPRFGCGDWISESQPRIDQLYAIGQYCDQLVPNGKGGFEPRFTINAYISDRAEAYKLLDTLAAVFRGMIYWGNGTIAFTQDAPASAIRIFSKANTIEEVDENGIVTSPCFTYSGSSRKARHTVALVSWTDPDDFYRTKVEYVEDREGIQRYGYRETEITAFGCTSQGQAHRAGRWLLYTERYETEIVNFKTGTEGLLLRPGELIKIADSGRAGIRMGGRLIGVTSASVVTLDTPLIVQSGTTYTLDLQRPDGISETREIAMAVGTHTTITVSPAFSFVPAIATNFLISASSLQPQLFRVISISEEANKNQYSVSAIEHNPTKFNAIEQGYSVQQQTVSKLPSLLNRPEEPSSLSAIEMLYESGSAGIRTKVVFSWKASPSPGIDRYQIEYKLYNDTADFKVLNYAVDSNYEWQNVQPGTYFFRVCGINKLGMQSNYVQIQQEIYGLAQPPSDITNATITVLNDQALLRWKKPTDLDVQTGGYIKIKHTPKTGSSVIWQDGFDVALFSGASDSGQVPLYGGTYMLKAIDSTGNESTNPCFVDTSGLTIAANPIVAALIEHPSFSGTKQSCTVINGALKIVTNDWIDGDYLSNELIDTPDTGANTNIDLFPLDIDSTAGNIDDPGDGVALGINVDDEVFLYSVLPNAFYTFDSGIDLGAVYPVRLSAKVNATITDEQSFIDNGFELFDSNETIDGDALRGATATLKIRTSQDGVSFGDYFDFVPGDYQCRAIQAAIALATENLTYNIVLSELSLTAELLQRSESGSLNSGASVTNVMFANPFYSVPIVTVSIENALLGDYYQLTNPTRNGFSILVRDASDAIVTRKINWNASGIGKSL